MSVIIPVYNVEKYIRECLDSIVNQTIGIKNIEVIVVNDCTPDKSMEIVNDYAEKYASIKIIEHEVNQGQGPARNTGLKHSTADYVTFIDSDDFISENTYEICLKEFERHQCDLVIYEYDYYSASGKEYPKNPSEKLFGKNRLIEDITRTPEIIFSTSTCNKIYSKKFLPLLNFKNTIFEDILVSLNTIFCAKKISVTNECKYYYRKRETDYKSTMDDYLGKKKGYFDHISIDLELYLLLEKYPEYKPLIDWFNARSSVPFLYEMIKRDDFSHKERKWLFKTAKFYFADISEDTLNKISPSAKELVNDVKSKSYWKFFIKYKVHYPRIKNIVSVLFKRTFKFLEIAFLVFISYLYSLNPKNREIWLFCERPTEAKDSIYRFFQYVREKYPEINAYYLIDKNCKDDYNRVKELGNVIQYGSWRHKIYFIQAEKLISGYKNFIEPWNYRNFKKYFQRFIPSKQYIFLPHGITKEDVSDILGKRDHAIHFDLFLCAVKPEYEYVKKNFGYLPFEVVYTGFARFDHLHNVKTKNQIVLMPTWRNGIIQPSWIKDKLVADEDFLDSQYYKTYQSLINNKKLIELLEQNDFNLVFYPHFEVQQYLKYFNSPSNRILIADSGSYDIQTLLIESKLLITDYSSVYFDFAYMDKPLVYYQFDKDYFFANHYKKGYFSYEDHGFGPVLENEEDIVTFVEESFENNFIVDNKYKKRVDEFFVLRDAKNCERIYNEIVNLENRYTAVDNLITEIFEKHTEFFSVRGLDVYCYNNFLMYVDSSKKVSGEISLDVVAEDLDNLVETSINLDFFFEDFCVTSDKRSKYNDKSIAIVKLPDIKVKSIKTGKTNKGNRLPFKINLKIFSKLNRRKPVN